MLSTQNNCLFSDIKMHRKSCHFMWITFITSCITPFHCILRFPIVDNYAVYAADTLSYNHCLCILFVHFVYLSYFICFSSLQDFILQLFCFNFHGRRIASVIRFSVIVSVGTDFIRIGGILLTIGIFIGKLAAALYCFNFFVLLCFVVQTVHLVPARTFNFSPV